MHDTGDVQRPAARVGVPADELLVHQIYGAGDLRVPVENPPHLREHPRQPFRCGARPHPLVAARAEAAEIGAAPAGFQLGDAVVLERRGQQVQLREDVGRGIAGQRLGGPPPGDRQSAATRGPVEAEPRYVIEVDVPVPVGEEPFRGGLPASPGDQQPRVALQQQVLITRCQAAAGDDQRGPGQAVGGIEQADHQVVLAEGSRDAEDVGIPGPDPLDEILQSHTELHVGEADHAEQGRAGSAGHVADREREPRQRKYSG